jgi:hypothetical protein
MRLSRRALTYSDDPAVQQAVKIAAEEIGRRPVK